MNTLETLASTAHLRAAVSLGALRGNLALVRRRLPADTELIACVKANAYGHGLRAVAGCLEGEGVRWLSLGNPAEALALRRWGIACDILLFPTGEGGLVSALGPAGTGLIFGDCLVHGSPVNMSPWNRRIFSLILNPVSNAQTTFARPDYKHHRDFTPVVPLADDCLLTVPTGVTT